ncbi:hypothetical protein [Ochrovirga pacifica]|uniref:hypothetical protein n=1 Tax=Ochrovirga pacifica TaxID=1042376 RepID=UPI0002558B16|nr:hypothetical protein [Ochrovirga pacifica]
MLKQLRNSIAIKILFGLLGFHLLNISIDRPKVLNTPSQKTVGINYPNSLLELLLEIGLGYEDAIDEFEEHEEDAKKRKQKNTTELELIAMAGFPSKENTSNLLTNTQEFPCLKNQINTGHHQLDTPPPKS